MVKIPNPANNQVQPFQGRLSGQQIAAPAEAFGSSTAIAANSVGKGLGMLFDTFAKLQEDRENAEAQILVDNVTTDMNINAENAVNKVAPSGQNAAIDIQNAGLLSYEQYEKQMAELPERLRSKTAIAMNRNINNIREFSFKKEDEVTRRFVADEANEWLKQRTTSLSKKYTEEDYLKTIDEWGDKVNNTQSLSEAERQSMFKTGIDSMHKSLATSIGYTRAKNDKDPLAGQQRTSLGTKSMPMDNRTGKPYVGADKVQDLTIQTILNFEGHRDNAYWDVNHYRVGFGSDTVTLPDGKVVKTTKDTKITKDDAYRDTYRRVAKQFDIINNLTGGRFKETPEAVQAAVQSVTWNYGEASSVVKGMANYISNGDYNGLATYIENLGSHNNGQNKGRRTSEANLIRTNGVSGEGGKNLPFSSNDIMNNPLFDTLTLDEKVALAQDADRFASQQYQREQSERTARLNANKESFMTDIINGNFSNSKALTAFNNGELDSSSYFAISSRAKEYSKEENSIANGLSLLGGGGNASTDYNSSDNKKSINDAFARSYLPSFLANNPSDIPKIVQAVDNVRQVPESFSSNLKTKLYSRNTDDLNMALSTATALQRQNPSLYNATFSKEFKGDIALANSLMTSGKTAEEVYDILNPTGTPAEIRNKELVREEGEGLLNATRNGVNEGTKRVKDIKESFNGWFFGDGAAFKGEEPNRNAEISFERDARELMLFYYGKTRDMDKAQEMAKEDISTRWSRSVFNNNNLTENSVEVTSSFLFDPKTTQEQRNDIIAKVAHRQLAESGIAYPEGSLLLVPDDITATEISKKGETIPSYQIWVQQPNGVYTSVSNDNGEKVRFNLASEDGTGVAKEVAEFNNQTDMRSKLKEQIAVAENKLDTFSNFDFGYIPINASKEEKEEFYNSKIKIREEKALAEKQLKEAETALASFAKDRENDTLKNRASRANLEYEDGLMSYRINGSTQENIGILEKRVKALSAEMQYNSSIGKGASASDVQYLKEKKEELAKLRAKAVAETIQNKVK